MDLAKAKWVVVDHSELPYTCPDVALTAVALPDVGSLLAYINQPVVLGMQCDLANAMMIPISRKNQKQFTFI